MKSDHEFMNGDVDDTTLTLQSTCAICGKTFASHFIKNLYPDTAWPE